MSQAVNTVSPLHDLSDYPPGSMVYIHMINFLTYDDNEIKPGPKMNIILGLNGSGKSTIVCAICVVLGGDIKNLGRGDKLSDYIQFNKTDATVELHLKDDSNGIIRIRRDIKRSGDKFTSSFKINGKNATNGDIQDICHHYLIDVNNLCQFLPQDRVQNFIRLDEARKLRAIEKAVGLDEQVQLHEELITLNEKWRGIEKDLAGLQAQKEVLESLNSEKRLNQHLLWGRFHEAKLEINKMKDTYNHNVEDLNKLKEGNTGFVEELNECKKLKQKYEKEREKIFGQIREMKKKKETIKKKIDDLAKKIADNEQNIQNFEQEKQEVYKNILVCEKKIESYKSRLVEYKDREVYNQMIKANNERIDQLKREREELTRPKRILERQLNDFRGEEADINTRITAINSQENQRLSKIRNFSEEAYKGYIYVRDHAKEFESAIYGPVFMEIKSDNPYFIQCAHNTISNNVLNAFIAQSKQDYDKLVTAFKQSRIRCQISLAAGDETFPHPWSADLLNKYNIRDYLDNRIYCPDPVRRILCSQHHIERVLIAGEEAEHLLIKNNKLEELCYECQSSMIIFVKDMVYSGQLSRFTDSRGIHPLTISSNPIRSLNVNIEDSNNESQLNALKSRLADITQKRNSIQDQIIPIANSQKSKNEEISRLNAESVQYHNEKDRAASMQKRIETNIEEKKMYEDKLKEFDDASTDQYITDICTCNKQRVDLIGRYTSLLQGANDLILLYSEKQFNKDLKEKRVTQLQEYVNEKETTMRRMEADIEQYREKYTAKKNETKALRAKAEAEAPIFRCGNNPDPNDYKCVCSGGKCKKIENTPLYDEISQNSMSIETIQECIAEVQLKLKEIRINDNYLQECIRREEQIQEIDNTIQNTNNNSDSLRDELDSKGKRWKTTIKSIIEKSDICFRNFMSRIRCEGRVSLSNEDNYEQCGLVLYVRFRESEGLQQLSSATQSGGEKSLTTILFLLSLQSQIKCPFRVIDEINQNMDDRNERYVLDLFMKSLEQSNNRGNSQESAVSVSSQFGYSVFPQTLLISPTLLRNIPYNEDVDFHIIFKGTQMVPSPEIFDYDRLVNNIKRLSLSQPVPRHNSFEDISRENRGHTQGSPAKPKRSSNTSTNPKRIKKEKAF
ncbi:hypothetical protein WA158_001653 [Blastocystis sp. Blastoise]